MLQSENHYFIELVNITKKYKQANTVINVLDGFNLKVKKGEMIAITGPSGCGKSTLLHIAGLLDKPDDGQVIINQQNCSQISDNEKTEIRKNKIGFVYQQPHLLQNFSALENVMLPMRIAGISNKKATKKAQNLLDMLKLQDRSKHHPSAMSGGEQQRVAIARALANQPDIILADEPTGNLDPDTANEVLDVLTNIIKKDNIAIVIVTHNMSIADKMHRRISMQKDDKRM